MNQNQIQWCIDQHANTNHMYDTYLPYEFHLRMVAKAAEQFKYLTNGYSDGDGVNFEDIELAAWGHDLIEDARKSFNDVATMLGKNAAEIVYAVTNEKGKTRSERANAKYYQGIRETEGAVFVKLCDRIANVQYSKMTGSGMFEKYKRENDNFEKSLGRYTDYKVYEPMFKYLDELFDKK